jgi:hypothetical protein
MLDNLDLNEKSKRKRKVFCIGNMKYLMCIIKRMV